MPDKLMSKDSPIKQVPAPSIEIFIASIVLKYSVEVGDNKTMFSVPLKVRLSKEYCEETWREYSNNYPSDPESYLVQLTASLNSKGYMTRLVSQHSSNDSKSPCPPDIFGIAGSTLRYVSVHFIF